MVLMAYNDSERLRGGGGRGGLIGMIADRLMMAEAEGMSIMADG